MLYRSIIKFVAFAAILMAFSACDSSPPSKIEQVLGKQLDGPNGGFLFVPQSHATKFKSLADKVLTDEKAPAILEALKGKKEQTLLKAMQASKVKFVAIPRKVGKKVEQSGNLAESFLHSGAFHNFYYHYLDSSVVIMGIAAKAYRASDEDLVKVMEYVRKSLLDDASKPKLPAGFEAKQKQQAIVELRFTDSKGFNLTLGLNRGRGTSVKSALDAAINRAKKRYESKGSGKMTAEPFSVFMNEARITINIYGQRGLLNVNEKWLSRDISLGLDGVVLTLAGKGKAPILISPDKSKIYRADKVTKLLETACTKSKNDKEAWKATGVKMEKFRTIDFTERKPGGEVVRLFRGVEYVDPKNFGYKEIKGSFLDGAEWLLSILDKDTKMFKYEYYPLADKYKKNRYNIIRHGLATLTLIQAYEITKEKRFLEGGRIAIEWVLDRMEYDGKLAYFHHKKYDRRYKLGGSGVMGQAMYEYMRFDYRKEWVKPMKGMAEFMMQMQEENGHYLSYYAKPGKKQERKEVTIYPGEANLALVRMYRMFKDKRYLETLDKAFKYYSKWFRDNAKPNRKSSQAAFVPWEMSAMMEYYEIVKRDEIALYAYDMADWIIDNWFVSDRDDTYWDDNIGGYHGAQRKWDTPQWNSGVYGEGVASVFRLAKLRGDKEKIEKYRDASYKVMRFIRQLQYRPTSSYYVRNISNTVGAIPSNFHKDDCRLDYAYHCLTVNYRTMRFFEDEDWRAVGVEPPAAEQEETNIEKSKEADK